MCNTVPVDEVGEVKVVDVVAGDDVRISLTNKLCPTFEQRRFIVVGDDVGADDRRAGVQREHVADERLGFALVGQTQLH